MPDASDIDLLRDYHRHASEEAFALLVQRHINLIYSTALRHAQNPAHAEEITQAVFVILARKAAALRPDTVLEAWLYETTRLTSLSFLRGERRRQSREQEAYMQSTLQESGNAPTWNQLAPLLDDAMARLGKKDREAVVLRFFKEKNLREVALAMNVSEAAAQSRVHRALEKLRKFFSKRGVDSTTSTIAGEISIHSVHAAPAGLAKVISAVAIAKGAAASTSTLTLVKGALKLMAWTKMKTAIVTGAVIVLAAGTTVVTVKAIHNRQNSVLPDNTALPADNGYDDLTNSATMLATNVFDYAQLSLSHLQTLVSSDSAALQLARSGLQKQCRVPVDYSQAQTATPNRLAAIKQLGLAFAAEARLAEMQGRTNDAVKSYLDIIHLGNQSSRGGVLIDQLVGDALEKMGTGGLQQLLPQLDAQTSRETAAALETLDAQRQTWTEVMQQENNWSHKTFPGVQGDLARIEESSSLKKMNRLQEHKFNEVIVSTRQLILQMASRAYELDKSHPPASVGNLVPDYLKAIPQDPFTGTNIVYSPQYIITVRSRGGE